MFLVLFLKRTTQHLQFGIINDYLQLKLHEASPDILGATQKTLLEGFSARESELLA
jgi:hypothetical protein